MDIPLDRFGARPFGLSANADGAVGCAPLDWPGLAARLAAAHAARQVLTLPPRPHGFTCGSFAPGTARDLAGWRSPGGQTGAGSSPGVNRNTKADGKPPRPIGRNDAGADRSIVRGLL